MERKRASQLKKAWISFCSLPRDRVTTNHRRQTVCISLKDQDYPRPMKWSTRQRLGTVPHGFQHAAERAAFGKRLVSMPALLRLPLDLRFCIYDILFPEKIRYIRCGNYIYGDRILRGRLHGIFLVNKQLLEEVKGYVLKTTTFAAFLGAPHPPALYADNVRLQIEQGLAQLSHLLVFVRHLTLSVSIGGHDVNEASILLLHYFRDCLTSASRPLGQLSIKFTTSQWNGSPGEWNLRPSFARSQPLRDSCAEVILAARYIRSDSLVNIDIPEDLQEGCSEACSVLQAYYNTDAKPAKNRPITLGIMRRLSTAP